MNFKSNFENISGITSKEDKISDESLNDLKLILKECDFNDNTKKRFIIFVVILHKKKKKKIIQIKFVIITMKSKKRMKIQIIL